MVKDIYTTLVREVGQPPLIIRMLFFKRGAKSLKVFFKRCLYKEIDNKRNNGELRLPTKSVVL